MNIARNLLILVIVAELIVSAYQITRRLQRVNPPEVNLGRLDPLTASDLERLRTAARDGTGNEWRTLGEAYLGNGYYVAAEQCFRQLAQRHPHDVPTRYAQGFCLERIGKTSEAAQVLQQTAVMADAELARTCWYQIGRCYLREEDAAQAEKAFRKIMDFSPAAYQLAKLWIRSGRAEAAAPLLEEHADTTPNSLKLIQQRRYAAEAMGDHEIAVELADLELRAEYQLILEYNQSFISMFAQQLGLANLLSRAMQYRTEGSLQDRKQALDAALEIILPNELWQYRSVLLASAHVELGLGNRDNARRLLELMQQHTHDGTDLLDLQALMAADAGDHQTAFDYWSRAAELRPSGGFYRLLANSRAEIEAADRRRYAALADMYDGIAAWRSNQFEFALAALERARGPLDQNATLHFYIGETHRMIGNIEQALAAYEACLRINPDHGRCLTRRQQLLDFGAADADRPL